MEQAIKEQIQELWDAIAECGASRTEDALTLLLERVSSLIDAQSAYWMGTLRLSDIAEKDPVYGWRPRAVIYLHPSAERLSAKKEHIRRINEGEIDPSVIASLKNAGEFRINLKHEMLPSDWFESEYYHTLFAPFEITDIIYVVMPLGDDLESWLAFERIGNDKPHFSEKERELLDHTIRPLKWFHRQLILHHGVMLVDDPLKPAERRVLGSLLTQKTEREIAEEHGLTPATVHTYCTRIYRKFNVRGRAGLTALWLGQLPPT